MLSSISPVSIVKHRPGFGQTVRPIAGAIVASPVLGAWDPDPDYFFHWFRDSAVVIDALRLLYVDRRLGDEALQHLRDFTRFSLALNRLDGRAAAAVPDRRARVAPDFLQFLREDRRPRERPRRCRRRRDAGEPRRHARCLAMGAPPARRAAAARAGAAALGGRRAPRRAPAGGGRRPDPLRPRLHAAPLARAVVRHLGRGKRPPLLHAARLGGRAGRRRRMAAGPGRHGAGAALSGGVAGRAAPARRLLGERQRSRRDARLLPFTRAGGRPAQPEGAGHRGDPVGDP